MLSWDDFDKNEEIKKEEPVQNKVIEKSVIEKTESLKEEVEPVLSSEQNSSNREEKALNGLENLDTEAGLADLEGASGRVDVSEKMMINCRADVNQLVPFKYDWAWQKYLDGSANHWMPQELSLIHI